MENKQTLSAQQIGILYAGNLKLRNRVTGSADSQERVCLFLHHQGVKTLMGERELINSNIRVT